MQSSVNKVVLDIDIMAFLFVLDQKMQKGKKTPGSIHRPGLLGFIPGYCGSKCTNNRFPIFQSIKSLKRRRQAKQGQSYRLNTRKALPDYLVVQEVDP
jgi:hypothetical protein